MKNNGEVGTRKQMLIEILNNAWKESKIPHDWKIGVIMPIYKKSNQKI